MADTRKQDNGMRFILLRITSKACSIVCHNRRW